jgi:hypothetical protein
MFKIPFAGKQIYSEFINTKSTMKAYFLKCFLRDVLGVSRWEASTWDKLSDVQQQKSKLFGQVLNYLLIENELNTDTLSIARIRKEADTYMKNKVFKQLVLECASQQFEAGNIYYGKKFEKSPESDRILEVLTRYVKADLSKIPLLSITDFQKHVLEITSNNNLKLN